MLLSYGNLSLSVPLFLKKKRENLRFVYYKFLVVVLESS